MATPLLEARHVSLAVELAGGKHLEILHDISLSLGEHQVMTILGPSGCGKSTLLRLMIGLQKPSAGEVLYRGTPVTTLTPSTALVFQNFALFPWLTVQENIAMGQSNSPLTEAERLQRLQHAVTVVGLKGFEEAYPKELSGGMKQRVGLARALVVAPEILCMDEPFSALDVLTAETLRNEIADLYTSKESPVNSILMITHSIEEAVFLGTHVVVMGAHPGTVRAVLENPLPFPRDEHQPEFLALSAKLHALVTQTVLPDEPPTAVPAPMLAPQAIPNVSPVRTIGLLEVLENEGDQDLFNLTHQVDTEFNQLLLVVKAAELLGWVNTPGQRVQMTPAGREFLAADIPKRKALLNAQLRKVYIFDWVLGILARAPGQEIDEESLLSQLALIFPHERPARLLHTVIGWARSAELFSYNSRRKVLHAGH